MTAIQNQQTDLAYLISINGNPITEHNRKTSISTNQSGGDVELARGTIKRYISKNKHAYNINFTYLPSMQERTVDGKKGRDYLKSLAMLTSTVEFSIKLDPQDSFHTTTCYVDSYSETLLRRDMATGCSYYDVSITLGEK
jgi:hypothetical protein